MEKQHLFDKETTLDKTNYTQTRLINNYTIQTFKFSEAHI